MDKITSVNSKGEKIEIRDGVMFCFRAGEWIQIDPPPEENINETNDKKTDC